MVEQGRGGGAGGAGGTGRAGRRGGRAALVSCFTRLEEIVGIWNLMWEQGEEGLGFGGRE